MHFKRVYLIGFMGSGKTTVGKALAKAINWDFIDLDEFIELKTGMNIPEIFEKDGEDQFRKLETKAINEISYIEQVIIATGGGAPCYFNNLEKMKENGLTIYLQLSAEEILERLKPAKLNRPLIANKSDEELLAFIKTKLSERDSIYKKANVTADATAVGPETYINILKTYQPIK